MIARLVLLLLALAVASAQNLRTDEHVPLDNARGARALQRMQTKAAIKHTKAAKSLKTDSEAFKTHPDALEKDLPAHGRTLQGDFDSPWTKVVMKGSLVTRSRPNSDCSGPVTEITVEPAGVCYRSNLINGVWQSEGIGTYVSASGELTRTFGIFVGSEDCSIEPTEYPFSVGKKVKPCQMLSDEYGSTGPLMGGTVLSGQSVLQSLSQEKDGFMVKHYTEKNCLGDALAYTLYRNDACHLDIEYNMPVEIIDVKLARRLAPIVAEPVLNADSTFSYVKVNKCQGNTVSITGYTDSACTRESYRAEVNLEDTEESAFENSLTCRTYDDKDQINTDNDYYDPFT
ncbi:hypothetical protein B484DRAFT_458315, partial [Ochromonadaceae sp. CCMP2298]